MKNSNNGRMCVLCEIFCRVSGYYRPVNQYNRGKREEFNLRKNYVLPEIFQKNAIKKS